ncbi:arabinan endo-1,5-alpha-L-arabinosidase [Georgenia halophila]|uniref:Arabinan endo-1,5-alpha-L-arabinosidase n=2 Tax=Georgenia halophila TaxID=620889 RepID=A0ABP8KXJ3_9MICO
MLSLALLGAAPAAADHGQGNGPPPSGKLDMIGDVGDFVPGVVDDPVHDPTLFKDGQTYYVFSTGVLDPEDPGGIYARRSTGTLEGPWESLGAIDLPEWTLDYDVQHLWAPHVVRVGDTYHLYYSASSFGTNRSAIGHATTRAPGDLDSWVDHGPILTSAPGDDYNAIDPMVFKARGQWYITFGSFWSGIKLQRLDGMDTPTGPITSLASNPVDPPNAIENPQIFQHGRYWYLTASWDFCCQGVDSTYRTVVGRSTSPTGPFVDRDGVPMTEGGGTVLLESRGNQIGTGALDVLKDRGRLYGVHHYYDADTGGTIRMQIREIEWEDGWPSFSYGPGDGDPPG